MLLKILLIILLLIVIFNLFYALYYMIKNDGKASKMTRFLGRRLLFSILIVVCILIALASGLITTNPNPF